VSEWIVKSRFKYFLFPLGVFYQVTVFWRNFFYLIGFFVSQKLPTKVISVGNITLGGTGKTPAVVYLVKTLFSQGLSCAVLSRGYGRKTAGTQLVTDGFSSIKDWRNFGDEPSLMARLLPGVPIVVDSNRHRGGMFIINKFKPDIIILDDAFQHRAIERDLDIVLINSQSKKSDYKLLPYGLLREPLSNLKRADLIILTKTNLTQKARSKEIARIIPHTDFFESSLVSQKLISKDGNENKKTKGKKIIALSAIGDHKSFFITLENKGMVIIKKATFVDHYNYKQIDIDMLAQQVKSNDIDFVVTTDKDMIKLRALNLENLEIYSIGVFFFLNKVDEKTLIDIIKKQKFL